ncbi:MAG: DNA helicase UvrD [Candidatus Omnitrophica bacterium]|nr:DNA helicase UvrD [Candidatus Omnitrophota bacterium]
MFIADFHIHSKYSLATSRDMDIKALSSWAAIKGISMLGTGDFTHPKWIKELKRNLVKEGRSYSYGGIEFILTAEVSNIYRKAGRTRKVHNIIFAPCIRSAEEAGKALSEYGRLASDGRPILKLDCRRMAKLLEKVDPEIFIVPAHIWTPHFGVLGAVSGFESLEECFEDETSRIFAAETGLSSDPGMNWRYSDLDRVSLISNSDAHSPSKLGREANVFSGRIDYKGLVNILKKQDTKRFLYTIEFFPEQGKYHWDGHRACGIRLSPGEAVSSGNACPACGKALKAGVMHRVEELADRPVGYTSASRPPYKRVIALADIISEALGARGASKKVSAEYRRITGALGGEIRALIEAEEEELKEACPPKVARGIMNARKGAVKIEPGYDGVYGTVKACA